MTIADLNWTRVRLVPRGRDSSEDEISGSLSVSTFGGGASAKACSTLRVCNCFKTAL